jgi:hypothetical protein
MFNYLASAKKVIGLQTACHDCVLTCHLSGNIQDDLHQRQGVDSRNDRETEKEKVTTEHSEIRLLNSVVILATLPIVREAVITVGWCWSYLWSKSLRKLSYSCMRPSPVAKQGSFTKSVSFRVN